MRRNRDTSPPPGDLQIEIVPGAGDNPHAARGEDARRIFQRDRTPHIFRPATFRSVTSRNRIMLSPMCQYSAEDGMPNDWHFQHLASRAVGGAGIVFTEAVHVEPRGLITLNCLGLWNDAQQEAFARIARFVRSQGAVAGIQIGHAGRKGSIAPPRDGGKMLDAARSVRDTRCRSPKRYASAAACRARRWVSSTALTWRSRSSRTARPTSSCSAARCSPIRTGRCTQRKRCAPK